MTFRLTILGCGSATPMFGRNPTAQVLNVHERFFLVDCGEGTQVQLWQNRVKYQRINHIFISHLHGDHYLGLMGLISSMNLNGRKTAMNVYCFQPLEEIINMQLKYSGTVLKFDLRFHHLKPDVREVIYDEDEVSVSTIPLRHRIPCSGFLFAEKSRPLNINKERLVALNIPFQLINSIKEGADYIAPDGKVIKNEELTYEAAPPRSYAFCSDTIFEENIVEQIKGVNLLYHEATFLHEMEIRAAETFHTTALQAAMIAKQAEVKQLLIGHFSSRYKDTQPLLDEARQVFDNTLMAYDGMVVEIED